MRLSSDGLLPEDRMVRARLDSTGFPVQSGICPAPHAHARKSDAAALPTGLARWKQLRGGLSAITRISRAAEDRVSHVRRRASLTRNRDELEARESMSIRRMSAARRMSTAARADEEWLDSIMRGAADLGGEKRFKEDSFLTEMYTTSELKRVILPFSRFRRVWDGITIVLVMYTAIYVPLAISISGAFVSPFFRTIDVFTDLIFVMDILINFQTAYVTKDASLEIDKKRIRKYYLTTWFPVDLVGSIPWEIIALFGEAAGFKATEGQAVQIIRTLKVPKLLRLGRLFKFIARFEGAANIGRIVMLMLLFMLLLHWLACAFYGITELVYESSVDGVVDSWLEFKGYVDLPGASKYVRAYYTVVLMIMGDNVDLQANSEFVFGICVGLVGSCVNAIIFANVANLTAQLNANSSQHQRRMDSVAQAMRRLNVEPSTARRIRAYFEYVWVRHRDHQGHQFITSLPAQLRSRTSCMLHEARIRTCPLFGKCDRKFVAALSTTLAPEVYLPGEFIVVSGFVSRAMYFIARGRVQLIRRGGSTKMNMVNCTDYFDEAGLFTERQQSLYARSITHTDLFKLERHDFERVVRDFPASGWLVASAAHRHMTRSQAKQVAACIRELVGAPEAVKEAEAAGGRVSCTEFDDLYSSPVGSPAPDAEDNGASGGDAEDGPEVANATGVLESVVSDGSKDDA